MDPDSFSGVASTSLSQEDEWDAEGFEIPSLEANLEPVAAITRKERSSESEAESLRLAFQTTVSESEKIYLGPHGAPPQQITRSLQETSTSILSTSYCGTTTRKQQRFNQKLKPDADQKKILAATVCTAGGRQNKV